MLIKINTVLANFNNTRPSLILNNQQNLQAICRSLGHDICYILRALGSEDLVTFTFRKGKLKLIELKIHYISFKKENEPYKHQSRFFKVLQGFSFFKGKSIKLSCSTGVSLIFKARKKPATRYVFIYRSRCLLNSFLPLFKLLGKCHLKYVCWDETLSTEALLFWTMRILERVQPFCTSFKY